MIPFYMAKKVGCGCNFKDKNQKTQSISNLLRTHGDNIPDSVIRDATSDKNLDKWETICSCDNTSKAISAVRYHKTDWYL